MRQLQQERADLGFLYAPIEEPGFAVEPIMEARMVCVLPQASPLAELSEVSPKQLLSAGVVITATSGSPGESLFVHLAQLGLRLVNVIETNFSYAALGLVRQGIGVFVTDPLILMSGLSSDVVVRRLVPELRVTLTMIYHRQRPVPRLAVRFMANLHDTLASMCASQAPSVCEAKAISIRPAHGQCSFAAAKLIRIPFADDFPSDHHDFCALRQTGTVWQPNGRMNHMVHDLQQQDVLAARHVNEPLQPQHVVAPQR